MTTHLETATGAEPSALTATWLVRLRAKVFAHRFDRQIDAAASVPFGAELAVHTERLMSRREREQLAQSLQTILREAYDGRSALSGRVPVHRANVVAAQDLIGHVILRLLAESPVRVRGVARLRLLLSDGSGPFYTTRRGNLTAAMRGVIAAF